MALEGTLKEFGLTDILQLIYYQRKTGVLTVEAGFDRVRILFYEGNIVFVESSRRTESRMGMLLLKKGLIKEKDLDAALAQQKAAGAKLGNALVKMGAISGETLRDTLVQQFTELISYLFTWRQGHYEFKPQGIPMDKDIPISLDTQHILMEGLRILDEWSAVDGKITLESIFLKTQAQPGEMDELEKSIYDLVDGENDVSTIASISGTDSFRISKTLLELYEKGLIDKKTTGEKPEPVPSKAASGGKKLPPFLLEGILAVLFLLSAGTFYAGYQAHPVVSKQYEASAGIDRLRFGVEVYRVENGRYPAGLEHVGPTLDPWGNPYVYKVTDSGFTLVSSGPDGVPGNGDDIH